MNSPPLTLLLAATVMQAGCSSSEQHVGSSGADEGGTDAHVDDGADAGMDAGMQGMIAEAGPGADASLPDHAGQVSMFVASGYFGRTIVSCDDGKTWVGNHSWDIDGDGLWCGPKGAANCSDPTCYFTVNGKCDQTACCNDTPDFSHGLISGLGAFVGNWGHGLPGVIRRSTNGIDWTTTQPNAGFGDLAFGGGRFVAASQAPMWSADGITWTAGGPANFRTADGGKPGTVRRIGYADYAGGGRFVAIATPPGPAFLVSSDGAATWWEPSVMPSGCGAGDMTDYGGIVSGNGVLVIVDEDGDACQSTDGGVTWSLSPIGVTGVHSTAAWNGSQFIVWGADADPGGYIAATFQVASPDGATWTKTPLSTPVGLGPVAVGASGTFVAINGVFDGYGKQFFLRSTDGLTWTQLPTTSFVQSHPLYDVTFGYADPSAICPL